MHIEKRKEAGLWGGGDFKEAKKKNGVGERNLIKKIRKGKKI